MLWLLNKTYLLTRRAVSSCL